jgi:hypothetical protein
VRLFIWLYIYSQHDLSRTFVVCCFLWLTYFQFGSVYAYCGSVDGWPMSFVGAAVIACLFLLMASMAAAFA